MQNMQKYTVYATKIKYAIYATICIKKIPHKYQICKNIPNMQYMQKYTVYKLYAKVYQKCKKCIICTIIPYISNMQNMQNIPYMQKYAKTFKIIPYKDSCIYMSYMHRSRSTSKNRTWRCAYFTCFFVFMRNMQK